MPIQSDKLKIFENSIGFDFQNKGLDDSNPRDQAILNWLSWFAVNAIIKQNFINAKEPIPTEQIFQIREDIRLIINFLKVATDLKQAGPYHIQRLNGMSYVQALEKARKWHIWHTKRAMAQILPPNSEREVMRFGKDFKIVELMMREALAREGNLMGHCLDNNDYQESFSGQSGFRQFSLRDIKSNQPHCTFETFDDTLSQCEGKVRGTPLKPEYAKCIRAFIAHRDLNPTGDNYAHGWIKTAEGYTEIENLPTEYKHEGDLDLSFYTGPLPKKLNVTGDLLLRQHGRRLTPDVLLVGKHLHLEGTELVLKPGSHLLVGGKVIVNRKQPYINGNDFVAQLYTHTKNCPTRDIEYI